MSQRSSDVFRETEDILLVDSKGRKKVIRIQGDRIHTHKGYIHLGDIVGKPPGITIKTHIGEEMLALRPCLMDYMPKLARRTQITYPKDLGYIIMSLGISPGSKVIEAGTGSGAATMIMANIVKPNGRVFSYDISEESIRIARRNLERVGLVDFVELKVGDFKTVSLEGDFDAAMVDLPEPWEALGKISNCLRPSARACIIVPTMNQIERTYLKMEESSLKHLETVEIMLRRIRPFMGKVRPESLMVGHTAYLMVGVKVFGENI